MRRLHLLGTYYGASVELSDRGGVLSAETVARALGDVGFGVVGSDLPAAGARPLHGGRGDRVLRDHPAVLDVPLAAGDAAPRGQRVQPLHGAARVVVLRVHVPGAQRARAGAAALQLAAALAARQAVQPAELVTRRPAAAPARVTLTFCECRFRTCSSLGLVRVQMASVSV